MISTLHAMRCAYVANTGTVQPSFMINTCKAQPTMLSKSFNPLGLSQPSNRANDCIGQCPHCWSIWQSILQVNKATVDASTDQAAFTVDDSRVLIEWRRFDEEVKISEDEYVCVRTPNTRVILLYTKPRFHINSIKTQIHSNDQERNAHMGQHTNEHFLLEAV